MGRFHDKVALITGAARGQGRAHAVRLAEEGASVIAVDLCGQIDSVRYQLATPADLDDTAELVQKAGGKIVTRIADVRDVAGLQSAVDDGIAHLGPISIVIANAGIMPVVGDVAREHRAWLDAIDVMLTGVVNTIDAALPSIVEAGRGGSVVITSSTAGLKGYANSPDVATKGLLGYVAAKHGVVGVMRFYASAYAAQSIRFNTVHPTGVNTPMVANDAFASYVAEHPDFAAAVQNIMPVDFVEAGDVANAVAFLCSDEARYITGVSLPVDAGFVTK